jgi:hypothetical protein
MADIARDPPTPTALVGVPVDHKPPDDAIPIRLVVGHVVSGEPLAWVDLGGDGNPVQVVVDTLRAIADAMETTLVRESPGVLLDDLIGEADGAGG